MKVLIGPNYFGLEKCISEFAPEYPDLDFVFCSEPDKLAEEIADAEIFMGWLRRDIFLKAKKLKWIQSPSSGINYYTAIPELVESDVLLTSARGTHGGCLADHAFALILAFTRHIKEFVLHQQERCWSARMLRPQMRELTGETIGIIGFGTIGRTIARRAQAFDMRILAVDVYPVEKPDYVESLSDLSGLDTLLRESDYVVVTVPYTPDTDKMIGAREIALMKPTALLIGLSRGGIIDESALIPALREKRIAGAGMDVFEQEPLPEDSELWDIENLLITPHVAGGSQYECDFILGIFKENIDRFLRGEFPLRNQIDKKQGF
ncbi:MAG TPA: D-2-hydroxyacid dehydrogenase [Chloroflexi bacterium]|jgi:D-2-hydroxyacid dehydrogenase (NADP+)|nr:D-2-hydroxyacid dehydrogenase [Chloroflexota bacterium]